MVTHAQGNRPRFFPTFFKLSRFFLLEDSCSKLWATPNLRVEVQSPFVHSSQLPGLAMEPILFLIPAVIFTHSADSTVLDKRCSPTQVNRKFPPPPRHHIHLPSQSFLTG